jgi:hypothetical protein
MRFRIFVFPYNAFHVRHSGIHFSVYWCVWRVRLWNVGDKSHSNKCIYIYYWTFQTACPPQLRWVFQWQPRQLSASPAAPLARCLAGLWFIRQNRRYDILLKLSTAQLLRSGWQHCCFVRVFGSAQSRLTFALLLSPPDTEIRPPRILSASFAAAEVPWLQNQISESPKLNLFLTRTVHQIGLTKGAVQVVVTS